MPTFQDFSDQLASGGVKIIGEDVLKSAVQGGNDWPSVVVKISAQGRKAGCWFKRASRVAPDDSTLTQLIAGYGFTVDQQRLFVQNIQTATDDRNSDPFALGFDAHEKGLPVDRNPYTVGSENADEWLSGFNAAQAD